MIVFMLNKPFRDPSSPADESTFIMEEITPLRIHIFICPPFIGDDPDLFLSI